MVICDTIREESIYFLLWNSCSPVFLMNLRTCHIVGTQKIFVDYRRKSYFFKPELGPLPLTIEDTDTLYLKKGHEDLNMWYKASKFFTTDFVIFKETQINSHYKWIISWGWYSKYHLQTRVWVSEIQNLS